MSSIFTRLRTARRGPIALTLLTLIMNPAFGQTTVAGFTPGSFRVTETGAASYRIPIFAAPGVAGMEPKLSLVYSSQAGNGPLGVGWAIDGLSVVHRCGRSIAQDSVKGGVLYDSNDKFCLDGQRLLAVSGTYGADGTEYRTERDGFARVYSRSTAGSGPSWFEVHTKAGQVMEYGNTTDSKVEAQGKSSVRVWALNKVRDTKGNYFEVTYTEDNSNGEFRLSRVDYTGNAGASLTPANSLRFTYASRSDSVLSYEGGAIQKVTQRLTTVQSYVGSTVIRTYTLSYDNSGAAGASRVTSIQECAGSLCMAATQFGLASTGSGTFGSRVHSGDGTNWTGINRTMGDMNGDGRMDLVLIDPGNENTYVRLSNGDGTFAARIRTGDSANFVGYPRVLHDVNGDGMTDLVIHDNGNDNTYVRLSNGDGTLGSRVHTGDSTSFSGFTRALADVNGDGKADLVLLSSGADNTYVRLDNGDGSFGSRIHTGDGTSLSGVTRKMADVNGDGYEDVVMYSTGNDYAYVRLSNGDGTFGSRTQSGDGNNYSGINRLLSDINGDGRTDLVLQDPANDNTYVRLSNGDGTFASRVLTGDSANFSGYQRHLKDVNNDGKPDVVILDGGNENIHVRLNLGDGTFTSRIYSGTGGDWSGISRELADVNGDGKLDYVMVDPGGENMWVRLGVGDGTFGTRVHSGSGGDFSGIPRTLADVNGDGKADWVMLDQGGENAWVRHASGDGGDFVTTITSGLGAVTTLTYKSMTDSAVYTRGSGATFPVVEVQRAAFMVSSVASSNGVGGTITVSHAYGVAREHLHGRGFLGFQWTESSQVISSVTSKTRTEFSQTWPYVGMPSLVKKTVSSGGGTGGLISQTSNTLSCMNPATGGSGCTVAAGNRYFPYVSQSVETGYDLNGATLPTVTTTHGSLDAYGNVGEVVVSTGDGYSKTTTNTYTNDTTNWLLGRLTRSTVASVKP